jgi:hypothetical protein
MLRKIHGTNFFHIKFLDCTNFKCQNGQVLPPAQVFYFNGQVLTSGTRGPFKLSTLCDLAQSSFHVKFRSKTLQNWFIG